MRGSDATRVTVAPSATYSGGASSGCASCTRGHCASRSACLLELTVVDPPSWRILGPLVWAECERALRIARRQPTEALQRRRVVLDGRLPELPR
jgi:hypothetical protein